MNSLSLRRVALQILAVVVALAAVLTSGAPAQSLGDVARKEEARRKSATSTAKTAGKVYTNEDLKGAPAPAAAGSTPPSSSSPSTATPAATPAAPDAKAADAKPADSKPADAKPAPDQKNDEATWRKKRQTLQDQLDRAKTFAEALQSRINGLTADFSARDDPAQRAVVGNERQKALTELDRVKKEIVQHTKALEDLQEEARKNGVPPGWLR